MEFNSRSNVRLPIYYRRCTYAFDKKQGSFKQVTTSSAVKQDLVISAYKPKEKFRREFEEKAGTKKPRGLLSASTLPICRL
jgi:hypothetical protein